jgi:endogenous inhibitor of DNA gyrase (YacG/DUF329 family)
MINARCPICDRPIAAAALSELPDFPFCSPRCRLIDLGRWLGEAYQIPPATKGEAPADHDSEDAFP